MFAGLIGEKGIALFGENFSPATLFILPPGAFLTLAFFVAGFQKILSMIEENKIKKKMEADRQLAIDKIIEESEKEEAVHE